MSRVKKTIRLAFLCSAFNEEGNLMELHRRCREVHAQLEKEYSDQVDLRFHMVVADNWTEDSTLTVLGDIKRRDVICTRTTTPYFT